MEFRFQGSEFRDIMVTKIQYEKLSEVYNLAWFNHKKPHPSDDLTWKFLKIIPRQTNGLLSGSLELLHVAVLATLSGTNYFRQVEHCACDPEIPDSRGRTTKPNVGNHEQQTKYLRTEDRLKRQAGADGFKIKMRHTQGYGAGTLFTSS